LVLFFKKELLSSFLKKRSKKLLSSAAARLRASFTQPAQAPLMKILVTGGAGFIGSHLALGLRQLVHGAEVVALDNLRRRGSELALPRLRVGGVTFIHGDVRATEDLEAVGPVDLLIECSAEPSVHAGYGGSPGYLVNSNLVGLINCLEHLRRTGGNLVFLSTSRVYPIAALREIKLTRQNDRLAVPRGVMGPGWSESGIAEDFPMQGSRSLYGATKLAAELLIEEYRALYGMQAVVNRCGVVAGPWQMGKVDQGFIALWLARHVFGGRLSYSGFGGEGLQVRDVLHVSDLCELVAEQIQTLAAHDGKVSNVGGGAARSLSLMELTDMCRDLTGTRIPVGSDPETRPADIPYYVSDCTALFRRTQWRPRRGLDRILADTHRWLVDERSWLEPILCAERASIA
jgi:CDP-paratose 2-epimerase